jgi:hypothetical protein
MWFYVVGARNCVSCQKEVKYGGLTTITKIIIDMEYLKKICKNIFYVAGVI